jgi:hypothetical protein
MLFLEDDGVAYFFCATDHRERDECHYKKRRTTNSCGNHRAIQKVRDGRVKNALFRLPLYIPSCPFITLEMDFMIRHEGRELGPYSESEIRTRLGAGMIALSDFARSDEATEWAALSSFAQFAPSDPKPPASAAPPPIPTVPPAGPDPKALGSYTAATLQENERPLHHTAIHWMALSGSIIGAILTLIVILPIAMFAAWKDFYWAWLLLVIPLGIVGSAIVTVRTSELVITDRRVLIKVGFIQRHTFEMFISKIESVAVFQSMLGRLFNYGTVTIRGTGGSSESFTTIAAPLQFRDAIQLVQSNSEGR